MTAIYWFEQSIKPVIKSYAKTELRKISQEAVTNGIKEVADQQDIHQLMRVEKDKQGKITMLAINSRLQAKMYSQVSDRIAKVMNHLRSHDIYLNTGQLLQSTLLADIGPKIPVQIYPKGATQISLVPRLQSTGINTVMISLHLRIKNEMGLLVPYAKDSAMVTVEYPLGEMLMVGEVPEFYYYMDQGKMRQGQTEAPQPPPPSIQMEREED
jgi:sporulation protein YunB